MSLHDKVPRLLMTNALVHVASIASSSIWFAMSVAALLLAVILPFTKTQLPPTIPRIPSETARRPKTRQTSTSVAAPTFFVVPRDANCHISLDSNTGAIRSTVDKSAASAITIVPPISGTITVTARPDRELVAVTATLVPDVAPGQPEQDSSAAPASTPSSADRSDDAHKPSPVPLETQKKPKHLRDVFRRRSKCPPQESGVRRRSASRSQSPIRKLIPDVMKREPSEAADAHGRIPYRSNPDEHELLETKFVNPFKRKSRRSSSVSSTPESVPHDLPTPPPTAPSSVSAGHTPRRLISSYLSRAMRPLHDAASRSPSPRRWSVSSSATTSSASTASSAASSCRAFPLAPPLSRSGSAPRTQPYGAPYFAPMPLPRPTSRRSSSVRVPVREAITEDDEEGAPVQVRRARTLVVRKSSREDNALGVSLGPDAARHRRYRSLDVANSGSVR
ncbi:hypothetical protein PHLGIDRAFT_436569 [Phlebiopsis gigantea 11061_1 CR5-6]|uniref:Uncharacterized protein n=1 Tax=Phlebiopsis gigantea (strain 11061_1 CR5-6) TaxID=745531 RepID=A0A0C3P1H1_PHLG1|nr:hypothetical protein PHLGIDRAFT_436569 [Phlebiopsis gigantea 11061_1 CR5-6]